MLKIVILKLLAIFKQYGIIHDYCVIRIARYDVDVCVQHTPAASFIHIPIRIGKLTFQKLRYKK